MEEKNKEDIIDKEKNLENEEISVESSNKVEDVVESTEESKIVENENNTTEDNDKIKNDEEASEESKEVDSAKEENKDEEIKNKKIQEKNDISKDLKENNENLENKDKKVEQGLREKSQKKDRNKNNKRVGIIILILLILLSIFSVIFALVNVNNKKVIKGVTINGIDVSSYTKEELVIKVDEYIRKNQQKIIELRYGEQEQEITPEVIGTTYNSKEIVESAYSIGRKDNIIFNNFEILNALLFKKNFELIGTPDDKLLTESIKSINNNLEGAVVEPSYYIDGETLFITKGKEGIRTDEEKLKKEINEGINSFQKEVIVIEVPIENALPEEIDIEKIHEEIFCEPQDAYVSGDPVTVHPNINGVDFAISIEEAKKIISNEQEEYEIPLKITIANKTLAELGEEAFPHQLGTFTTNFYEGESYRSTNIRVATQKINGTILLPGETFSYNATVGKRTIEAGFKPAGAYSGGKVVQEVGGGICQVSSTLYNAVLYANLEIVERHNHCFESSYVAASRDATVSWGGPDFKFKNNRKYPVKVVASSSNGREIVSIYGLKEEEEYEVVIQSRRLSTIGRKIEYIDDDSLDEGEEITSESGHDGCTSEAYRILKKDGEVISSTLLSKDTYIALARTIRRGTRKSYQQEPVEEVVVEPSNPVEEKPEEPEKPANPEEE